MLPLNRAPWGLFQGGAYLQNEFLGGAYSKGGHSEVGRIRRFTVFEIRPTYVS